MSGRIPWALWEPIANRSRVSNSPVRMTVHITAVRANDIYGPNKGPGYTYAHAHNSRNGDFRQHQELNKMAEADLDGNGETIAVENEGREGDSLTDAQIDNLARVFAHCVTELGVPNRIATPGDTTGLAWHRLGVTGNFGTFKASDMTTWSRAQTGKSWSTARGKTCPTDKVIRQIPEIYERAQAYINRGNPTAPIPQEEDDMTPEQVETLERIAADVAYARKQNASIHQEVVDRANLTATAAARRDAAIQAQVTALAKVVAQGSSLDIPALLAEVEAASERGVSSAIKTISTTTTATMKES